MRLEVKKYLFDIRESAKLIVRFTDGRSFADYAEDPQVRSAVERQFMTLGEALSKLSKIDPDAALQVSQDYRRIIAFRNVWFTSTTQSWTRLSGEL